MRRNRKGSILHRIVFTLLFSLTKENNSFEVPGLSCCFVGRMNMVILWPSSTSPPILLSLCSPTTNFITEDGAQIVWLFHVSLLDQISQFLLAGLCVSGVSFYVDKDAFVILLRWIYFTALRCCCLLSLVSTSLHWLSVSRVRKLRYSVI